MPAAPPLRDGVAPVTMRIASSMRRTPRPVISPVSSGWFQESGHEADGGEVVDLVGLHLLDGADERRLVEQVAELDLDVGQRRLDDEALGVVLAADEAVDLVALGEQVLGEVEAVLAGDAGDERCWHGATSLRGFGVPTWSLSYSSGRGRRCRGSAGFQGAGLSA